MEKNINKFKIEEGEPEPLLLGLRLNVFSNNELILYFLGVLNLFIKKP